MNFKKLIMVLFLAVSFMFGQSDGTWTANAEVINLAQGKVVKFTFSLDSAGTLTSNSFAVHEHDDFLWSTETIQATYKFTSVDSLPKLSCYIDGSYDNSNFARIDTLFSDAAGEVQVFANTDLNSIHAPYLRVTFVGIELGADDQTGFLQLYFYQGRDEY